MGLVTLKTKVACGFVCVLSPILCNDLTNSSKMFSLSLSGLIWERSKPKKLELLITYNFHPDFYPNYVYCVLLKWTPFVVLINFIFSFFAAVAVVFYISTRMFSFLSIVSYEAKLKLLFQNSRRKKAYKSYYTNNN